jgi:phosphatidylglycerol---prolipoprotein diacylglyceryl transferase
MNPSPYSLLLLAGIVVSLVTWSRLAKREPDLLLVYVGGLLGGFIGAKVVYLLAEGWRDWPMPDRWLRLATGKTILGALMGGYLGVEVAKRVLGYSRATGDLFAVVAPIGIILGRIGCLLHGCCAGHVCEPAWYALTDARGVPRWPAVPVEIVFNVVAIAGFLVLRRTRALPGQHFHLYLIGYGAFRFAHEFVRDTPRVVGSLSGYHLAALACAALGVWGFARRARGTREK